MAHNKKRNTAFLFESLTREATKAIIEKDIKKANLIKSIIVKHFNNTSEIKKELDLYKALDDNSIESEYAEKYLQEVKNRHDKLDKRKLFNEKTALINTINKSLGVQIYNNFVPNYKNIATISQIFNDSTPIKEKVLLENVILSQIKKIDERNSSLQPVDKILYKTFTKKFNEKYSGLLSEQKDLLTKFVNSFSDNGLELKIFLNEEIERLKDGISKSLNSDVVKSDNNIEYKVKELQNYLAEFKNIKEISKDILENVLKIQEFVHEVNN